MRPSPPARGIRSPQAFHDEDNGVPRERALAVAIFRVSFGLAWDDLYRLSVTEDQAGRPHANPDHAEITRARGPSFRMRCEGGGVTAVVICS